ncbi:peptidase T [Endozoicomonas gorgoniicola]|uniref:Peptidase T n=1 Tax=Endozoicomonas gorgoniicola TaxID=1234144 RepID=A0ABT3MS89_9GAMM|nr:peptidase T [Endozoicomonas gorgoniicola]MCW7551879.1 peptidase T [Endozoicomonas gorgoniicola]
MSKLLNRFLSYVQFDTQSNPGFDTVPSTSKQFELAKFLKAELETLELSDISLDDNCYLMARLPANTEQSVTPIGFVAHMDTAFDYSGENVKPQIIKNYDGKAIALGTTLTLSPAEFPELDTCLGKTLITTDGTTLLGADNKAGIAEILTAVEYLVEHPEIKHGDICIGFTPDEEIGRGANHFDVEKFGAEFAYTIDGGPVGELQFENFNAAQAQITVYGKSVHPGHSKNKMVNAMLIAAEFINSMPKDETPATTDGYQGFFHLSTMDSNVSKTSMQWLIRDFDKDNQERRKTFIENRVAEFNKQYGDGTLTLEIKDYYRNMREMVEPRKEIINLAQKAMEAADIKPLIKPIRGGTDGARLSFKGLPCPNVFTGGYNFHGPYEFIALEDMEKAVEVIVNIACLAAE